MPTRQDWESLARSVGTFGLSTKEAADALERLHQIANGDQPAVRPSSPPSVSPSPPPVPERPAPPPLRVLGSGRQSIGDRLRAVFSRGSAPRTEMEEFAQRLAEHELALRGASDFTATQHAGGTVSVTTGESPSEANVPRYHEGNMFTVMRTVTESDGTVVVRVPCSRCTAEIVCTPQDFRSVCEDCQRHAAQEMVIHGSRQEVYGHLAEPRPSFGPRPSFAYTHCARCYDLGAIVPQTQLCIRCHEVVLANADRAMRSGTVADYSAAGRQRPRSEPRELPPAGRRAIRLTEPEDA